MVALSAPSAKDFDVQFFGGADGFRHHVSRSRLPCRGAAEACSEIHRAASEKQMTRASGATRGPCHYNHNRSRLFRTCTDTDSMSRQRSPIHEALRKIDRRVWRQLEESAPEAASAVTVVGNHRDSSEEIVDRSVRCSAAWMASTASRVWVPRRHSGWFRYDDEQKAHLLK